MSAKEASIRLDLKPQPFKQGLRQVIRDTEIGGKQMGASLAGPMREGLGSIRGSLGGLVGDLKTGIKWAATLGGAFTVGGAIRSVIDLNSKFHKLAFNIAKSNKELGTHSAVTRIVTSAADESGASLDEMVEAFDSLQNSTGSAEFAAKSLAAVGTVAEGTGEAVHDVAAVAQTLQRKFGMDDVEEGLVRVWEKFSVIGKGMADFSSPQFADVLGDAAAAGWRGADGLTQFLGVLSSVDARIGERSTPAFNKLFEALNGTSRASGELQKKAGIKFKVDDTVPDKIRKILQSPRARKAAEAQITGDARVVFDELAKPFDEAVKTAKEAGFDASIARDAGLGAFDEAMSRAAASTKSYADIQGQAKKLGAEDPAKLIDKAMKELQLAFMRPEMIDSLKELAKVMPKFLDILVDVVEFGTKHPLLAAGMVGGGKAAMSMGGALIPGAAAGAWGLAKGAVAKNVQKQAAGHALQAGLAALSGGSGTSAGAAIAAGAAASGAKWAAIGKMVGAAGGVALGAAAAYYVGTKVIDSQMEKEKADRGLESEGVNALQKGVDPMQKALVLDRMKKERDRLAQGPGFVQSAFSGLGEAVGMVGGDSGVKTAEQLNNQEIKRISSTIADLEAQIAKETAAKKKATEAQERAAASAGRVASAFEGAAAKINQANGSSGGAEKGPVALGAPASGSAPVRQGA